MPSVAVPSYNAAVVVAVAVRDLLFVILLLSVSYSAFSVSSLVVVLAAPKKISFKYQRPI